MKTANQKPANSSQGCIAFFIGAIVIFGLFKMCTSNSDKADSALDNSESMALVMSRRFVEKQLKSPSSADFGSDLSGVRKVNDSTFNVRSYVDSQNSFGAMLRTNYSCKIIFTKNDMSRCEDLILE